MVVFGLSMVGILAGKVALKGMMAAGVGMLVATIGEGPFNGELRMASYDFYLADGLKLVIVGQESSPCLKSWRCFARTRQSRKEHRLAPAGLPGSATGGPANGCRCAVR